MGWLSRIGRLFDVLLTRVESYTALTNEYPEIRKLLRWAAGLVMGGWSFLQGSSLPIAITVGLVAFAALYFVTVTWEWRRRIRGSEETQRPATARGASPEKTAEPPPGAMLPETEPEPEPAFEPKGLYVGNIHVSDEMLSDQILVFAVKAFNASGQAVSINRIHGNIHARSIIGGTEQDHGKLPPPRLAHEKSPLDHIDNNKEIFIILEQRITRELHQIIEETDDKNRVYLRFDDFSIAAYAGGNASANLPLWNGVTINRSSSRLFVGQINDMKVTAKLGSLRVSS